MIYFSILVTLLVGGTHCTTDVDLTAEPENEYEYEYEYQDYVENDARHLQNQEPLATTSISSTSPTTEPLTTKDLYTVDYQEASRRGKTDVVVRLIPRSSTIVSDRLDWYIEYNKRIRRIKKVWGGTARVVGNNVYFRTDYDNSVSGVRSFGYTIDYKGQRQLANYPVFMDIRMIDDSEF